MVKNVRVRALIHFFSSFNVAKDDDIEYYDDPSTDDVETNSHIVVTSESGR